MPRGIEQAGVEGNGRRAMIETVAPNFTGRNGAVFYVNGTPSKRLCEWADMRGLIRYPSYEHRNHALSTGPKPASVFDGLPDEPAEETTPEAKG